MSNYKSKAYHPTTGKLETVDMLDNHFGHYYYGVEFPDGSVYREEEVRFPEKSELPNNPRPTKIMEKVFCPICGELEVVKGEIQHPSQDVIYAKILDSGCAIHYTGKEVNPIFSHPQPMQNLTQSMQTLRPATKVKRGQKHRKAVQKEAAKNDPLGGLMTEAQYHELADLADENVVKANPKHIKFVNGEPVEVPCDCGQTKSEDVLIDWEDTWLASHLTTPQLIKSLLLAQHRKSVEWAVNRIADGEGWEESRDHYMKKLLKSQDHE